MNRLLSHVPKSGQVSQNLASFWQTLLDHVPHCWFPVDGFRPDCSRHSARVARQVALATMQETLLLKVKRLQHQLPILGKGQVEVGVEVGAEVVVVGVMVEVAVVEVVGDLGEVVGLLVVVEELVVVVVGLVVELVVEVLVVVVVSELELDVLLLLLLVVDVELDVELVESIKRIIRIGVDLHLQNLYRFSIIYNRTANLQFFRTLYIAFYLQPDTTRMFTYSTLQGSCTSWPQDHSSTSLP